MTIQPSQVCPPRRKLRDITRHHTDTERAQRMPHPPCLRTATSMGQSILQGHSRVTPREGLAPEAPDQTSGLARAPLAPSSRRTPLCSHATHVRTLHLPANFGQASSAATAECSRRNGFRCEEEISLTSAESASISADEVATPWLYASEFL